MSRASREARTKRRQGVIAPFQDLLKNFEASSILRLIEAAAVSPTAAHRAQSLGRLFLDTVRLWPNGQRTAAAADLPELVAAAAKRNPEFSSLEDYVPLDPRRDVRTDWGDQSYRILPGCLERPVAMMERARTVDAVTADALLNCFGFALGDLAKLVLCRLDEAASVYSRVWPPGDGRPSPSDRPIVGQAEVECSELLASADGLIAQWGPTSRVVRALDWATRDVAELRFDPYDGSSMFGPVLAVRRPEGVTLLPTGLWPDSFEASLVQLAQDAARAYPATVLDFWHESRRAFMRLFAMSRLRVVGPFALTEDVPSLFALLVDESTVVLLDLVGVLDAADSAADVVGTHFEALEGIGSGEVLNGPSGQLRLGEKTHLVRVVVISAAGHVVVRSHPPVAAASFDDLVWITAKTRETPQDIFYFFNELANGNPTTAIIGFETINIFEHWRANGKCIARQGQPWNLISVELHRGDGEWDEAADWTPVEAALRTMGFPPLRTWASVDGSNPAICRHPKCRISGGVRDR
jgi:hypothetical protein